MKRFKKVLILSFLFFPASISAADSGSIEWLSEDQHGNAVYHLYFFWSENCPHCLEAKPFIESLATQLPWLKVHTLEITQSRENAITYSAFAKELGRQARSVPAFFYCGQMTEGYDNESTTGSYILKALNECYVEVEGSVGKIFEHDDKITISPITIPIFGELDPATMSLPLLTVVLAGMDSINPCAFFVLLFLLSLLVHAQSRKRIVVIGAIFVFFSGLIYFLFMAAWLNLFMLLGQLNWVTLVAGLVAITMAVINIKDYFWFKKGVTLSIPDRAKPGLYARMRNLLNAERLPVMFFGTITLALAANSYELLCTAGFPLVYTRILTMHEMPVFQYYFYLAAYNVIYIIPLSIIVILFTVSLGSRKLKEREGRYLKLLSGNMMLGLGCMLVIYPDGLSHIIIAIGLIIIAFTVTALLVKFVPIAHRSDRTN